MPCVQAKAKQDHDAYIRSNRRDVNEFEGVSDPVEILKITHGPRRIDPLVKWVPYPTSTDEIYLGLDQEECERLCAYADGMIGTDGQEVAEDILRCLAAFTNYPLDRCLRTLLSNSSFWPSLAFRNAPPDVRDGLLCRVEEDGENRNLILLALAWIGDPVVVSQFQEWRLDPPEWRGTLFIPPEDYSREAGWELAPDGQRRDLYFKRAVELRKGSSNSSGVFGAISPREDSCPWCGSVLTDLFHFDLSLFALGPSQVPQGVVRIPTCEVCTAFGTVFGATESSGAARWSERNVRPEYLPEDAATWDRLPVDPLQLGANRPPLFAADQFLPTGFSQLGGHPTWIEDASYPACPECGDTMMFVAQVDHEDIEDCSEGIFYAFLCPACRMTATTYQQT